MEGSTRQDDLLEDESKNFEVESQKEGRKIEVLGKRGAAQKT